MVCRPAQSLRRRFYDGESWTERVILDGRLVTDPDFAAPPSQHQVAPALDRPASDPAVEAVATTRPLRASLLKESPVRNRLPCSMSLFSAGRVVSGPSRTKIILALVALVVALAFVGFLLLRSDETPAQAVAEPVDLDANQEERVEDLEEGGFSDAEPEVIEELVVDAPTDADDQGATFGADEMVEVGALRVVNGASMLRDLEDWHRGFAAERGIELAPDAGCLVWSARWGGSTGRPVWTRGRLCRNRIFV